MARISSTTGKLLRNHRLALVLMTIMAFGLRIAALGRKPLWSAEIQEIFNARCSQAFDNIRDSGSDILGFTWHHLVWRLDLEPLAFWSRLPSVVWGTLAVPVAYAWGARLFSRKVGLLAALMTSCSVFLVDLSQTARWYIAAAVAGNAATICLIQYLAQGNKLELAQEVEQKHGAGSRLGYLVAFWFFAAVCALSHGIGLVFLLGQSIILSYLLLVEAGTGPMVALKQGLKVFLPTVPFAAIQTWITLSFRAKLLYHQNVFLVGRDRDFMTLADSVLVALSGGWAPFWVLFLGLAIFGAWCAWHRSRAGMVSAMVTLLAPIAFLATMVGVMGFNAFDVTFVSFLFAPAYVLVASALDGTTMLLAGRRHLAVAATMALLSAFVFTNGRLLGAYYAGRTKPVLGADFERPSKMLQALEPTRDDYLFYTYDDYFTHLAFYAADELQVMQLVARRVPSHSRALLMEYLHRLNGCADRPRVQPDQVRSASDLAGSTRKVNGRIFVIFSCPQSYPARATIESDDEVRGLPDLVAWILSKGASEFVCAPYARKLGGFQVFVFAGSVLAVKDAAGITEGDLYEEMSRVLEGLPQTRLRLNPLEEPAQPKPGG